MSFVLIDKKPHCFRLLGKKDNSATALDDINVTRKMSSENGTDATEFL